MAPLVQSLPKLLSAHQMFTGDRKKSIWLRTATYSMIRVHVAFNDCKKNYKLNGKLETQTKVMRCEYEYSWTIYKIWDKMEFICIEIWQQMLFFPFLLFTIVKRSMTMLSLIMTRSPSLKTLHRSHFACRNYFHEMDVRLIKLLYYFDTIFVYLIVMKE